MKNTNSSKIYVIDTNVLLHDPQSIFKFEDNLVVIPIAVLEELDTFKKGQNENGKNSRQVSRYLDQLRTEKSLSEGVALENGGCLKIDMNGRIDMTPDNAIIDTACSLKNEFPNKKVAVVSKDINLRIKADARGVGAEDFESDKVKFHEMYTGVKVHECDGELIDRFYSEKSIKISEIEDLGYVLPNQYIVLKNVCQKQKGIARYDAKSKSLVTLIGNGKNNIWGITPNNLEQTMAMDLLLNDDIKLVSLVGKAGTGKTLLAVASGLKKAIDEQIYKKMLVARPIIPMGRDLGYLPGDLNEKMDPWLKPIFDNMEYLFGCNREGSSAESYKVLIDQGFLAVEPLTYIRGRSLPNQYIIIDESQNLTAHEIKTIVTRAGEGTKIVLTGDCYQIDNPYVDSSSNGLSKIVDAFKEEAIAGHITLLKGERSELADIASNLL